MNCCECLKQCKYKTHYKNCCEDCKNYEDDDSEICNECIKGECQFVEK